MAETAAKLFGLNWCKNRGYDIVWGETDYMLLTIWIKKEWRPPWALENQIQEIQKLVDYHGFNISHCFREANKPADKLAALSHGLVGYMSSTPSRNFLDILRV
uniref:RNase H type-1 domain-containing protein n=1 Tax=Solanum lycopersicum TaxID=4081 RepID=A0A3Q7IMX9_SOLLC